MRVSGYYMSRLTPGGPALLLLNFVSSSIRNCLWPSSRLHGLQLFLNLCPFLLDEDKVDRIVPFVVELLSDDVAIVRAEACRTLVIVVSIVTDGEAVTHLNRSNLLPPPPPRTPRSSQNTCFRRCGTLPLTLTSLSA